MRYIFRCPDCGTTWDATAAWHVVTTYGLNTYKCDCYTDPKRWRPVLPPQVCEQSTGAVVATPSTLDDLAGMAYLISHHS